MRLEVQPFIFRSFHSRTLKWYQNFLQGVCNTRRLPRRNIGSVYSVGFPQIPQILAKPWNTRSLGPKVAHMSLEN